MGVAGTPMIRTAARILAIVTLLCPTVAAAQGAGTPSPQPPPANLTLEQALQYAVDHYPTVRAALEQLNASTAGVGVAKSAYWPRLDSLWQSNRGTANNIFGQVLPQSVIPAMSGPVLTSASSGSVWGSATGALFSWEPSTSAFVTPASPVPKPRWLGRGRTKNSRGSTCKPQSAPHS